MPHRGKHHGGMHRGHRTIKGEHAPHEGVHRKDLIHDHAAAGTSGRKMSVRNWGVHY